MPRAVEKAPLTRVVGEEGVRDGAGWMVRVLVDGGGRCSGDQKGSWRISGPERWSEMESSQIPADSSQSPAAPLPQARPPAASVIKPSSSSCSTTSAPHPLHPKKDSLSPGPPQAASNLAALSSASLISRAALISACCTGVFLFQLQHPNRASASRIPNPARGGKDSLPRAVQARHPRCADKEVHARERVVDRRDDERVAHPDEPGRRERWRTDKWGLATTRDAV